MKILHVSGWLAPRYGGSTQVVVGDVSALASIGHTAEIITTNADGPAILDVETGHRSVREGVTVTFHRVSTPRRFLTSWPMLLDLRRRVSEFDVVHVHSLYRFHTIVAASIARRSRVPYVLQPHGSLDPWHRSHRRYAKTLYHAVADDRVIRGAAAVVCASRAEEQAIRRLGYLVPTWVIPVGVAVDDLRRPAPKYESRARPGQRSDAKVIAFLGRISEKKGLDLLVDAFVITAAAYPTARLVIAGPDDERIGQKLSATIAGAGLEDRVEFPGLIGGAKRRSLLQSSDVIVLPSADESFGIVVAEAMAVGCPVIVSPQVATAELVKSTGAGIVAQRDSADLARAIQVILSDPDAAARMGQAGRRTVERHFTWQRVAFELERLYAAVGARKRASLIPANADAPADQATGTTPGGDLAFVCPLCRAALQSRGSEFACTACNRVYPVVDDIPVLLPTLDPIQRGHAESAHAIRGPVRMGDEHKFGQADHFDHEMSEEFEIERPRGTPRLYRFLLDEKFRRAALPIGPHLVGAATLIVCGGSGMDAEYLARAGARVVSSDISLGAARRTKERARRHGVQITSIVADVEHLPFPDRAFDLVLVHDGLHHLERPGDGLAEMARVASTWVSVTEPARAAITAVAVRLGLAKEREEAGNVVARLTTGEVKAVLVAAGFSPVMAHRYAMYYRHVPGLVSRALSSRGVFTVVRGSWRMANALIGRMGNKMVVVAERQPTAAP